MPHQALEDESLPAREEIKTFPDADKTLFNRRTGPAA
jgi:hypothetical protein